MTPAPETVVASRSAQVAPNAVFFPAAALHAALVLPWSVLAMTAHVAGPRALAGGAGHAHEMLLGFALAVVAGYQLPPMSHGRLALVFGAWLGARMAFLASAVVPAAILDAAFAGALVAHVVPRLLRAAKKPRNRALPAIVTALAVAAVATDVAVVAAAGVAGRATLLAIVLLLATLMLFMGGRIIAPAVAGHFYRQGRSLDARVQPRIEATLMLLMAAGVAATLVPGADPLARASCAAAGTLAFVRLWRWRIGSCTDRPDLLCLAAGYAWIGLGLLAIAAEGTRAGGSVALHAITVGALGTLTFNVMAATMLRRARRDPARDARLVAGTLLIGAAAALRLAAGTSPAAQAQLLVAAAAGWSLAFALLCTIFIPGATRPRAGAQERRG